jgi:hypothetical protein
MPRKQHTHHYIYKVTCNVTGKYYIGMHSSSNLEDGYFGSGKVLKRSLNKHGKENHSIEILEWLPDRSSLKAREREIVNEDMLCDPMCMNLKIGGDGGNSGIDGPIGGDKFSSAHSYWNEPENKQRMRDRMTKLNKTLWETEDFRKKVLSKFSFSGKTHTSETKNKIGQANSLSQSGSRNSQFGKMWIFSQTERRSIKINKGEADQYLSNGWLIGRRFTF